MTIEQVFSFIVNDVHTVVAATSQGGLPVTCAIDIMDWDNGGLYFLTARGKGFYRRLKDVPYISFTGVKGEDTMHRVAVTVRGQVRPESSEVLARLIEKNAYMREIYPTVSSRRALEAFCIYSGEAEWFDLSQKPIVRFGLSFGGGQGREEYVIGDGCTSCGKCLEVCPQSCIVIENGHAGIINSHCLCCGNCKSVCPVGAVALRSQNENSR